MKSVLIICSSFPPQSMVGGLRPAMLAKYFIRFGWNPWVITRDFTTEDSRYDEKMPLELPQNLLSQLIKVNYSIYDERKYLNSRNILHKIRDFFYPEYSSPPGLFFAVKRELCKFLQSNKIDLVFATIPDQWQLTLGAQIAKRYKIPLIADFRDIKEQEEDLPRSFRTALQVKRLTIRRYFTTRHAAQITTVSEFHKHTLEKKLGKNCAVVYNGYDESLFKPLISHSKTKPVFRIVYIGRILDLWYRNPEILFKAVDELLSQNTICLSDISVEFFGTETQKLDSLIMNLSNPGFIKFYDRISYSDIPAMLNEAQILLLLTNKGRDGILTTKFFEYAGVKKPILCIPGDNNELDSLILKHKLGYSVSDAAELKNLLINWIGLFKKGKFPDHIQSNVEYFTRENQTKILADIFDQTTNYRNA